MLLDILKAHEVHLSFCFLLQSYLHNITDLCSQYLNCCVNSCIAYTEQYFNLTACSHCQESQYALNSHHSRKKFSFILLIDHLKLQYSNLNHTIILSIYHVNFISSADDSMCDFFDENLYHQFHVNQLKLFQDFCDVTLQLFLDNVQVTNRCNFKITSVIFINLNLSSDQ